MADTWNYGTPEHDGVYICAIKHNNVPKGYFNIFIGDGHWNSCTNKWNRWDDCDMEYKPLYKYEEVIAWMYAVMTEDEFFCEPRKEIEKEEVAVTAPTLTVGMILETAVDDSINVDIIDNKTGEVLAVYDGRNAIPTWFNKIEVIRWDIYADKLTLMV